MKKNNLARGEQVRMRNGSESVTESLHLEPLVHVFIYSALKSGPGLVWAWTMDRTGPNISKYGRTADRTA